MAVAVQPTNPFLEFVQKYQNDSVAFVREVVGREPYPDQIELLRAYDRGDRRIAKRTGHGVGKSTSVAWMVVHHILFRFPQKTLVTAPSAPQLFDSLAAEVKSVIAGLPAPLKELLEVQVEGIYLRESPSESFVTFRTAKQEAPESLAGLHSVWTLLVGDEASGLAQANIDAMSGSLVDQHATMVLIGNPVRTSGQFFDAFGKQRALWTCFHTSCVGHPNVSAEEIETKKIEYGEESNRYRVRVLGEFPTADEDTIIPFALVEAALHRDVTPIHVRPIWGVDVARFGSDSSALCKRQGNALVEPVSIRKGYDTMQVTGWIKAEWDKTPDSERPTEILVDVIGIGAGVTDRLRELGLPCRGINVAETGALDEQYPNIRSELWFKGFTWFDQKDSNLKGDDALAGELVQQRYKYLSNGKRMALTKDEMKSKFSVPSLNRADAFLLTLASEPVSAVHGSKHSVSWTQPLKRKIAGIV